MAASSGREYREGYQVIAYDHVQERHLFQPARARVLALDVRTAPGVSVGYVMGAGDEVAEAIRQLGVPLTLLAPDDLAFGDLGRYSTIVTGITRLPDPARPALVPRTAHEVRRGGRAPRGPVQQARLQSAVWRRAPRPRAPPQRSGQPDSPFAPYPAAVTNARVTDETAPVRLLAPDSVLLTAPNRLGDADWAGWVQERGLYFLEARDPRYSELLAMADPFTENPGEKKGALVEAHVGKGTWTYVGLGLFRQLPAGVPGAYRLLANLVSRPRRAAAPPSPPPSVK